MKRSADSLPLVILLTNGAALATLGLLVGYLTVRNDFSRAAPMPPPLAPIETVVHASPEEESTENALYNAASYPFALLETPEEQELARYGKRLIDETFRYLGPHATQSELRYAGNELACKNCHLDSGRKPFAAPYVGVTQRFPAFGARGNRVGTLEDRINGCMERSMNGERLPKDGREMRAIVAYMELLGMLTKDKQNVPGTGFVTVAYPDRAVSAERGAEIYQQSCASCHGPAALGKKLANGPGYQYPPLAGDDSFNTGAGMHRVLTAMAFIKANMPLGATAETPFLSDEDAYDVAGYINSLPRPVKARTEADYPDRTLKPLSTPYPPYADDFPQPQHQFGPFGPIRDYYINVHGITKSK